MILAWIAVVAPLALGVYTYVGYPLLLKALAAMRSTQRAPRYEADDRDWPAISITVPAYNEEHQIADTVESLLALEYPADRKQILIVSDASTDATDEIVRRYADRGITLLRQPERAGKTAAENLAAEHLTGDIVVNTDASIRIHPRSLERLIAPFRDPSVGLASGRDVSVGREGAEANQGEAGYVGYEMWVRDLETKVSGIVGASGCFYAIRRELHRIPLPPELSRDFAAALNTRERGFRAVSVADATCVVPRTASLRREFPRKVRTMARGMETLLHKRALLNPFRHGLFAWMLFSHKVCRWALPWAGLVAMVGMASLAPQHSWAGILLAALVGGSALGAAVWAFAGDRNLPWFLSVPGFAFMGNVAAIRASILALRGDRNPIWEPTRREASVT